MIRIYCHQTKRGWQSPHELANIMPSRKIRPWGTEFFIHYLTGLPSAHKHFQVLPWRSDITPDNRGYYLCHHGYIDSLMGCWDLLSLPPEVVQQINDGRLTLLVAFVFESFDTEPMKRWQDRFCTFLSQIGIVRAESVVVLLGTHASWMHDHRDSRVQWHYYPFFEAALQAEVVLKRFVAPDPNTSTDRYKFAHMIRTPRIHRHLMAMILEYRDLTAEAYVSWPNDQTRDVMIEAAEVYYRGLTYHPRVLHWMEGRRILAHQYHDTGGTDTSWLGCDHVYRESRLELIGETHHNIGDQIFITEKTFRAMLYGKPFLLYGCRHALRLLHELGYRTFGDIWSEKYDGHTSPVDNIMSVADVLSNLCSENQERLRHSDLTEITRHNQQTFLTKPHANNLWSMLIRHVGA